VNPNPARFHDPQFRLEWLPLERLQELADQPFQQTKAGIAPRANHHNTGAAGRREASHVRKIQIQGYQAKLFPGADGEESLVSAALEALISDRLSIVSGFPKKMLRPNAEILVELESHPLAPVAIST